MTYLRNFALFGTALLALGACTGTMGNVETAPPYSSERTATYMQKEKQPVRVEVEERVVEIPAACEYDTWQRRVERLENELAQCRTARERVQESYRGSLRK